MAPTTAAAAAVVMKNLDAFMVSFLGKLMKDGQPAAPVNH
jgi:hypothetical protein